MASSTRAQPWRRTERTPLCIGVFLFWQMQRQIPCLDLPSRQRRQRYHATPVDMVSTPWPCCTASRRRKRFTKQLVQAIGQSCMESADGHLGNNSAASWPAAPWNTNGQQGGIVPSPPEPWVQVFGVLADCSTRFKNHSSQP